MISEATYDLNLHECLLEKTVKHAYINFIFDFFFYLCKHGKKMKTTLICYEINWTHILFIFMSKHGNIMKTILICYGKKWTHIHPELSIFKQRFDNNVIDII